MKQLSLFSVSFLFFIITTNSIFVGNADAAQNTVRDANGKKVLNNVPYHLGPVTLAKGGGIKLTNTMNNKKICPFNVVQDPSVAISDTFMFTLINKNRPKYLLTSSILGIDSGPPKGCDKWTFWTIPDPEAKAPNNLITTGGQFEDETTCFQVVEYPKPTNPKVPSYMLQHCPSYCGGAGYPVTCYNVSSYVDNGVKRFASKGTPFEFVFHEVPK